jgi:hypothetical protein
MPTIKGFDSKKDMDKIQDFIFKSAKSEEKVIEEKK